MALYRISSSNPIPRQLENFEHLLERLLEPPTPVRKGEPEDDDAKTGVFLMLNGTSGIGKTTLINRVIKKMLSMWKLDENRSFEVRRLGSITAPALVQLLWELHAGGLLVADDAKGLFLNRNNDLNTVLKHALDTQPVRTISYSSTISQKADLVVAAGAVPQAAPSTFTTKAKLLWCFNADLDDPAVFSPDMKADLEALLERASGDISISRDPSHLLDFTLHVACEGGMLRGAANRLTCEQANDSVKWFLDNIHRVKTISPRRLERIAQARRDFPDRWTELCAGMLYARPVPGRAGMVVPKAPRFKHRTGVRPSRDKRGPRIVALDDLD